MKLGDKFGYWIVSGGHKTVGGKKTFQLCTCVCGLSRMVLRGSLVNGASKSCGCHKTDNTTKHGMWNSKEYKAYQQAKKRCTNVKDKDYPAYGGRGIKFNWPSFEVFIAEMGMSPEGTTLGRSDNDGPYGSGNCLWETWVSQARNKRNTTYLTAFGETRPLSDWADEYGIAPITLRKRVEGGWVHEKAITTPVETKFHQKKKKEG